MRARVSELALIQLAYCLDCGPQLLSLQPLCPFSPSQQTFDKFFTFPHPGEDALRQEACTESVSPEAESKGLERVANLWRRVP
jgi:hypothetical protein